MIIFIFLLGLLVGALLNIYLAQGEDTIAGFKSLILVSHKGYKNVLLQFFITSVFLALYLLFKISHEFVLYVFFTSILTAITIRDLKEKIIPNHLVLIGLLMGLLLTLLNPQQKITSSLIGALAIGGISVLIYFISKGGFGMGDVKLLTVVGLYLGWWGGLIVLLKAAFLSGMFGIFLLTFRIMDRKGTIPFAPFVYFAILLYIFLL